MTRPSRPALVAAAAAAAAVVVLALALGRHNEPAVDPAAGLCEGEAVERYLDFFWDDVRTRRQQVFEQARRTCLECPEAPKCAPVASVASWYEEAADHPPAEEETP